MVGSAVGGYPGEATAWKILASERQHADKWVLVLGLQELQVYGLTGRGNNGFLCR